MIGLELDSQLATALRFEPCWLESLASAKKKRLLGLSNPDPQNRTYYAEKEKDELAQAEVYRRQYEAAVRALEHLVSSH